MSGLVAQQIAADKLEREERMEAEREARKQSVLNQESYEHENLLTGFRDNFELFTVENESKNLDALEHALAVREEIQELADDFKDRDRPCHICIFGLMGHGKSRFINMMLTAVSQGEEKSSSKVLVSDEVPSGDGSTTRSYSRYMIPITGRNGKNMMYLVDTIGVKFADEFNPTHQEIDAEFSLVRSQLRGLDFRKRVGVIAKDIPHAGPAASTVVKGEDIMTIVPDKPAGEEQGMTWLSDHMRRLSGGWLYIPGTTAPLTESQVGGLTAAAAGAAATATVTLRGGHAIRGVPFNFLADPDGSNWCIQNGVFREKRGFGERLRHVMAAWRWYQPRCQAVFLKLLVYAASRY
jgi:hypothetical protein